MTMSNYNNIFSNYCKQIQLFIIILLVYAKICVCYYYENKNFVF